MPRMFVEVDDNGISVGGGCICHINLAGVLLLHDLQLVFDLQLGHLVRDLLRFDPQTEASTVCPLTAARVRITT